MGSVERKDPLFIDALKAAYPSLQKMTPHEIASWIVARLNFITGGAIELEGKTFSNDTNEFGYKLRISDEAKTKLAHGAVMFHANRTYFESLDIKTRDFQAMFIELLADSPSDLAKCEIIVCEPESKRQRAYGWNGYSILNR